jgi:hypothetical protein
MPKIVFLKKIFFSPFQKRRNGGSGEVVQISPCLWQDSAEGGPV